MPQDLLYQSGFDEFPSHIIKIRAGDKMASSKIKSTVACDIHKVWEMVTAVNHYAWRSDLSKTEILSDTQFVEYTNNGYATVFTVTAVEMYRRWEFDMENDHMKGHWTGIFTPQEKGTTVIEFTEHVIAKKFFMKPFVKLYLKRQQIQFLSDLRKALLPASPD